MTVVESPKGRASHNLGNRCAIPTFPPPGYCYIFFQNLSRKESSSPPAPSLFRLILRLEKTYHFLRLVAKCDLPCRSQERSGAPDTRNRHLLYAFRQLLHVLVGRSVGTAQDSDVYSMLIVNCESAVPTARRT